MNEWEIGINLNHNAERFARKGIKTKRWGEDSRYNNKNSISISGAELYSGGIRNPCEREEK